jgi:hypothetical protein
VAEDLVYVSENLHRGDYVVVRNGAIYKYYPEIQSVECDHYDGDESKEFNCMWLDIYCPLDLACRKYCNDYKPKKE